MNQPASVSPHGEGDGPTNLFPPALESPPGLRDGRRRREVVNTPTREACVGTVRQHSINTRSKVAARHRACLEVAVKHIGALVRDCGGILSTVCLCVQALVKDDLSGNVHAVDRIFLVYWQLAF